MPVCPSAHLPFSPLALLVAGRDFNPEEPLSVSAQVDKLILQATSLENLCQCFSGWYVTRANVPVVYTDSMGRIAGVHSGESSSDLALSKLVLYLYLSVYLPRYSHCSSDGTADCGGRWDVRSLPISK